MLLALKHNPALAAAGLAVETAEADMARARARFLPTVNFNETYNFSDNPSQVFMSKLNQRVFTGQDFLLNSLARLLWATSRPAWAGRWPPPIS
jgi:outer membrane protein TolC